MTELIIKLTINRELTEGQKEHKKKLMTISATTKDARFEDTEVGRVSMKLQKLMAIKSYATEAKKRIKEKILVTNEKL